MDILAIQPQWIPLNANVSAHFCNYECFQKVHTTDDSLFITACLCPDPDKPNCYAYSNVQEGKIAGQCSCKSNVEGQDCDRCKPNHWNLTSENPLGCQPCDCSIDGSNSMTCDQTTGKCHCKENVTGQKCDRCKTNHWNLSEANPDGCAKLESSLAHEPGKETHVFCFLNRKKMMNHEE